MIEHLQSRLRQAHQRAADIDAHSARAALEEHAAMLRSAHERVQELEDANAHLQVCGTARQFSTHQAYKTQLGITK